ncbi:MAG: hypothetical protein WDO73_13375 [Ignavibacteriota bacterium]
MRRSPTGPPYYSTSTGSTSAVSLPTLVAMANDNLTVLAKLHMPENIVGRIVMNAAASALYAISDSGVMALPVGSLNQAHRVTADREDMLVSTTFLQ